MGWLGGAGRGADDGEAALAEAEERAGVVGREAMFEIEIGRQIEQAPGGELLAEEGAEMVAEAVALALFAERGGGWFGLVVERDGAEAAAEAFDGEGEAAGAGFGDGDGAAVQLAGLVPGGDEQGAGVLGQFELAVLQGEGKLPRFLQDRLAGGGEKGFDRCLDAGGFAPRGPLSGSWHYRIIE